MAGLAALSGVAGGRARAVKYAGRAGSPPEKKVADFNAWSTNTKILLSM